jgi:hypothetical protein
MEVEWARRHFLAVDIFPDWSPQHWLAIGIAPRLATATPASARRLPPSGPATLPATAADLSLVR